MADEIDNAIIGDQAAAGGEGSYRDITFGDSQTGVTSQFTNKGNADNVGGMNVANFATQLVGDPKAFFSNDMQLSQRTPDINPIADGTNVDGTDPTKFGMQSDRLEMTAATGNVNTAADVRPANTATYQAETSFDRVTQDANTMKAAQGDVRPEAVIKDQQMDMQGLATGTNADGTTNFTGQALNAVATQNISNVIDTSTVAGKLLAQTLGEGNYTDAKATMKGQLDILSKEFTDPVTGEPKIPTWAAGAARNVARIAAFKGVTGTAATAAMAQAIMEASLPIAQQDAQFFQTLTVKNLDNKQQQVINTANILSKMELANLDARMQTAVENAKNFMTMDLQNLSNEQQTRVINTQARVQSILEDSKSENAARLFEATSINEQNKFYDNLRTSIQTFNATQKNSMEQFNSGQINDVGQFNAQLENSREQFYKNMQYNIDIANAKWRQTVTLTEADQAFQAAAADVKNIVGLSVEQLNQLWDRSDALLDYAFKSSDSEAERTMKIAVAKMQNQTERDKINAEASDPLGQIVGTIAGSAAGTFGKAAGTALWAAIP